MAVGGRGAAGCTRSLSQTILAPNSGIARPMLLDELPTPSLLLAGLGDRVGDQATAPRASSPASGRLSRATMASCRERRHARPSGTSTQATSPNSPVRKCDSCPMIGGPWRWRRALPLSSGRSAPARPQTRRPRRPPPIPRPSAPGPECYSSATASPRQTICPSRSAHWPPPKGSAGKCRRSWWAAPAWRTTGSGAPRRL